MKQVSAATAKNTSQNQDKAHELSGGSTALHRRYGKIGISAVAAAARYQGIAMNPAYAPVPTNWRSPADEAA